MSFSVLLWNAPIQLYRSSQILADFLHSLNRLSGICVPSLSNSLWSTANVNQERSTPTFKTLGPKGDPSYSRCSFALSFSKQSGALREWPIHICRSYCNFSPVCTRGPPASIFTTTIYNHGHAASFANAVATKRRTKMCSQAGHWSQRTCSQCPLGLACCLKHRTTSSDRDENVYTLDWTGPKIAVAKLSRRIHSFVPLILQQVEMGHIACGNSRV